jgi:hypothetical protein
MVFLQGEYVVWVALQLTHHKIFHQKDKDRSNQVRCDKKYVCCAATDGLTMTAACAVQYPVEDSGNAATYKDFFYSLIVSSAASNSQS